MLEDDDVARAVHGLEGIFTLFRIGGEHVFAVLVPVAGLLPQALVQNLRSLDFLVAVVLIDAAHVLLDLLPDRPALGVPEHGAGRMLIDVEQIQLAPQLAVIALFGFFQPEQIVLKLVFGRPSGTVDALQHLVAVVATPVGTGHLHQLEVLELAGAGHVRAAAQILESAFAVKAHVLVAGNGGNDLGLVGFAETLEVLHGLVARQHAAHHLLVLVGQLGHLLFDGSQIFGREGTLVREVVVETVFDHRADGDLRIGKQLLDGIGQQVSGRVADHLQTVGILGGDDGQRRILLDHKAGVHDLAVDLAGKCRLGQAGADRSSDFSDRNRARIFALGAIGERDVDHEIPCQTKFVWVRASARALELPESKKRGTSPRFDEGSRNLGQARTASCHQQLKYISDVVRGVITVDAFLALVN